MNRVLSAVAVAIFSACVLSWQLHAGVVNITQGSTSGYTMTDGNTYVIQNSVSFSNISAGGSGMSVEDGATVVLYVPVGVTLTAIGANGSGRIGGGAGIHVPETATLVITGEGAVNATGGNAGDGEDGEDGANGGSIKCGYGYCPTGGSYGAYGSGSSGGGGSGGCGGGGAGAGVGGFGGCGGNGGAGGVARVVKGLSLRDFSKNGNSGYSGENGVDGSGMGECYVIGRIRAAVFSGESGKGGNSGKSGDWVYYFYDRSSGNDYHFATSGGGGGGGGGAGKSPSCSIGGGGASGGGGGGGGSGATAARDDDYYDKYPLINAHGGGGTGGSSDIAPGETGVAKEKTRGGYYQPSTGSDFFKIYYYGGDGGTGGAAGAEGGAGALYVSPTTTVNVERDKLSATTHPAAQYTITFNANGGQYSTPDESLTATLGCELPDCIPTPTRSGYLFDGWMMISGEEYYDASGTKRISSYPMACDVILYAKWHLDDYYTAMTPEPVPYTYFSVNYPSILSEHGDDYEAAAKATAANGRNKVWECYVTGLSPTNETAKFAAKIEMKDGTPVVTWKPDLNTNGIVRIYKVYGSETLENGGDWQYPTNSLHKFFKVTVEMP